MKALKRSFWITATWAGLLSVFMVGCEQKRGNPSSDDEDAGSKSGRTPRTAVQTPPTRKSLRTAVTDEFVATWLARVPSGVSRSLAEEVIRDPLSALVNAHHGRFGFSASEATFALELLVAEEEYEALASILLELPADSQSFCMAHFLENWLKRDPVAAAEWASSLRATASPEVFEYAYGLALPVLAEDGRQVLREALSDPERPKWERELAGQLLVEQILRDDGIDAANRVINSLPKDLRTDAREAVMLASYTGEESLPEVLELILSAPPKETPALSVLASQIQRTQGLPATMQFLDELRARDRENPDIADAMDSPFTTWASLDWAGAVDWLVETDNLTRDDRSYLAKHAISGARHQKIGLEQIQRLEPLLGEKEFQRLTTDFRNEPAPSSPDESDETN